MQRLGVRPELEVFDTGGLVMVDFAARRLDRRPADDPALQAFHTVLDDPGTLLAMVNRLPANAVFSAFAIGRMQIPFAALAVLLGGNVRVGLEANLYLSRGVLATHGQLVERAVGLLESMNVRVLGPEEVRDRLHLVSVSEPTATVGRVGLLGAGVIGGGWAARFLLSGIDVLLHDPDPDAERKVGEMLANARRSWSRLTMAPLPEPGSLTVVDDIEQAVSDVDFLQDSAPEQEQLKRELLARAAGRRRPARCSHPDVGVAAVAAPGDMDHRRG